MFKIVNFKSEGERLCDLTGDIQRDSVRFHGDRLTYRSQRAVS
jgi:hypothetical protein